MAYIAVGDRRYEKPNMAALEGELGRSILDAIRSTPKPSYEALDRKCSEVSERMRKAKADGTF